MTLGHKKIKEGEAARAGRFDRQPEPMRLTVRDRQIVRWVFMARLATREQVQRLFFGPGGHTRCQRRLTLLYRNRYLDKLQDQGVNEPDILVVSRRATRGLRLLRELFPDQDVAPRHVPAPKVQHSLDIASCRIAFVNACAAAGYALLRWQDEDELAGPLQPWGIVPDAYFQVARRTADGVKRAGFFLEVERSAKSQRALTEKFKKYAALYYQGHYERHFGTRALRVLVLFGSDYGINPQGQIQRCAITCRDVGLTLARFAALKQFLVQDPANLFTAALWQQPADEKRRSLF